MNTIHTIKIDDRLYTIRDRNSVQLDKQELTEEQKAAVRENIGAAAAETVGDIANALEQLHQYALALIGGDGS